MLGNTTEVFPIIAQKVAEAIEAVIGIDVTIMNSDMIRIAGTGIYKDKIGIKIENNTAFGYCLKTGNYYVVEKARESAICKLCERIHDCEEKAEICMPIKRSDIPVGVIGVIAFNDSQRDKIVKNKQKYVNYIQKMAELLEAKFYEVLISKENHLLSLRLNNILNAMEDALLVFNNGGKVLYKNHTLMKLLSELGISNETDFLRHLWHELKQKKMYKTVIENKEIHIKFNDQTYTLIASVFLMSDINNEFIVKLQEIAKFEKKIIKYTQQYQVSVNFDSILSVSENMIDVKETARKASELDSNVLIYGESGTGKELFARAIHNESKRKDNAFIPINCGAIPDELLESELFGHEKGAFTGAINTKIGKFEVADGGTIFLDEISEMPFALQVKLLRVLQEKEICRIGSNETKKIDIRIIAATNANLLMRIYEGSFREDLYYRLNIIPVHIPPLRERHQDIMYLSDFYIHQYNQRFNKKIKKLSKKSEEIFIKYQWPGNVRELQNVLEYAANFEVGEEINEDLIHKRITGYMKQSKENPYVFNNQLDSTNNTLSEDMNSMEKELIAKKMDEYKDLKHKDIVKNVCKDLNISRTTFYRRLKKYDLCIKAETVPDMKQ